MPPSSRRQFLKYTCSSCVLASGLLGFCVNGATNQYLVQSIKGKVQVNKKDVSAGASLTPGDTVSTAENSSAVLLFGGDSYLLKQSTTFVLPNENLQDNSSSLVSGAVLASFLPGKPRRMLINQKSNLVVRGTGVYVGIEPEMTEFCLCYGEVDLYSDKSNVRINTESKFHKDFVILDNGEIRPAFWYERRLTHTSRQNIELERIAGRPSPFDGGYRDFVANFESSEL
jgi:hypothetical protein